MLALSSRPLRTLLVASAFGAAAGVAAAPASAKTTAKTSAKAKSAKKAVRTAARADLLAKDLDLDFLSDGFALTVKLANTGDKRARKSNVTFALSADTVLDPADDVLASMPVGRIQPGASRTVETELEIPDDLAEGDLYLLACADGAAAVKEKNETNNCTSQLVAADAADSADDDSDDADNEAAAADADDGSDAGDDSAYSEHVKKPKRNR